MTDSNSISNAVTSQELKYDGYFSVRDMVSGVRFNLNTAFKPKTRNYVHPIYLEEYETLRKHYKSIYINPGCEARRDNVMWEDERLIVSAMIFKCAEKGMVLFENFTHLRLPISALADDEFLRALLHACNAINYATPFLLAKFPKLRIGKISDCDNSSMLHVSDIKNWCEIVDNIVNDREVSRSRAEADTELLKMCAARDAWKITTKDKNKFPKSFVKYVYAFIDNTEYALDSEMREDYAEFWALSGEALANKYANSPISERAAAFVSLVTLISTLDTAIEVENINSFTSFAIAFLKEKGKTWCKIFPSLRYIWNEAKYDFTPNKLLQKFLSIPSSELNTYVNSPADPDANLDAVFEVGNYKPFNPSYAFDIFANDKPTRTRTRLKNFVSPDATRTIAEANAKSATELLAELAKMREATNRLLALRGKTANITLKGSE